jgi:glycerol-3-phosphate dehydrogenase
MPFSYFNRPAFLSKLTSQKFDVLVIGGGITGVGIALDSASRGLKTALLEKNDFAYGTSSRSTKLIHGGLRYLKQFEFALVKEVGSERAVVHKLAPHLVVPEMMLLPLREGRGFGSILTSFGLWLYDWLAGVNVVDRRKMLSRGQTLRAEPLLNKDGVKGGGLYAEYRTDDARLTIEIAKQATAHGAILYSYALVTGFIYAHARVSGVRVTDTLSDKSFEVNATCIINATGPWVDTVREFDNSKKGKTLHLTKGVHIVVSHSRFPIKQAIYFDVADGRMIFAIPRGDATYIGTTDTDYHHEIDQVKLTTNDVQYLLHAVNESFTSIALTASDVQSGWAGLRPLIHEDGKSASELSRKDEIFESPSGLLSIAGGKLTGYRKMAERVVNLAIAKHFANEPVKPCHTHKIPLAGGGLKNTRRIKRYTRALAKEMHKLGFDTNQADRLVHLYGKQSTDVLNRAAKLALEKRSMPLLQAELDFCIDSEMVVSAADFLVRRTGMLYFDIAQTKRNSGWVVDYLAKVYGWDNGKVETEVSQLTKLINEATQFS